MNKLTLTLLLLAAPAAVFAADDCAKNADACAGGKKTSSPFAAASLAEMKQGPVRRTPELKPAPEKKDPGPKTGPEPAPGAVVPEASAAPVRTAAPRSPAAAAREDLSSPLWLFFVGGSLAGLYFYLRGGARKGRKK